MSADELRLAETGTITSTEGSQRELSLKAVQAVLKLINVERPIMIDGIPIKSLVAKSLDIHDHDRFAAMREVTSLLEVGAEIIETAVAQNEPPHTNS